MFYKNNLLILLIISMFTFFEKADAKYEKLFFDHSIKNINNETMDLNQSLLEIFFMLIAMQVVQGD